MKKCIFVRVPRTASTNFTGILSHIYKGKVIRDLVWQKMPAKERTNNLKNGKYFYDFNNMSFPDKNMRKYSLIEGHFLSTKYKDFHDEYDFVTFLRDPVERLISHFNIIPSRQDRLKIDIRKFADIYKNFHKALIGDLSQYTFIGITEMFNYSVNQFYEKFDIPSEKRLNIRKRSKIRINNHKRGVSKSDRDYIRKINAEDYEIYNSVKKSLEESKLKNIKWKEQEVITVTETSSKETDKQRRRRIVKEKESKMSDEQLKKKRRAQRKKRQNVKEKRDRRKLKKENEKTKNIADN